MGWRKPGLPSVFQTTDLPPSRPGLCGVAPGGGGGREEIEKLFTYLLSRPVLPAGLDVAEASCMCKDLGALKQML